VYKIKYLQPLKKLKGCQNPLKKYGLKLTSSTFLPLYKSIKSNSLWWELLFYVWNIDVRLKYKLLNNILCKQANQWVHTYHSLKIWERSVLYNKFRTYLCIVIRCSSIVTISYLNYCPQSLKQNIWHVGNTP
jgi:hypothetical protein